MRFKAIWLGLLFAAAALASHQSVATTGGLAVVLPSGAPWSTIGASNKPARWETRIHNFGTGPTWNFSFDVGPMHVYIGNNTQLLITYNSNLPQRDTFDGAGFLPSVISCCTSRLLDQDVLIRLQRDVVGMRYTLELCDTRGGNCSVATAALTALATDPSWVGFNFGVGAGYKMAFLRWFSTVVPTGTTIPITGVTGDVEDWEFDGNANGAVHSLNMSGDSTFTTTPTYAPACDAGAQQAYRAGYVATLDGTHSQPLDEGLTLSYLWQEISGAQPKLAWSAHSGATPKIRGLVAGAVNLQLTVTDGLGVSSTCTIHDGAVPTDNNDIVVSNNTTTDLLLGPMPRLGANPYPFHDRQNIALALLQYNAVDTNFPNYWDTAAPGTISVSPTQTVNSSASGTGVVGTGTSFLTTFPLVAALGGAGGVTPITLSGSINSSVTTFTLSWGIGPGNYIKIDSEWMLVNAGAFNVTRGQLGTSAASHTSGAAVMVNGQLMVPWWNAGANRTLNNVNAVVDDTHLATYFKWSQGFAGSGVTTESGLGYSAPSTIGGWGYASTNTPGNYYDSLVMAANSLCKRSLIDFFCAAFQSNADRWWRNPAVDKGQAFFTSGTVGSEFKYDPRSEAGTGMAQRAAALIGAAATDMWAGLRTLWAESTGQIAGIDRAPPNGRGNWDQRILAYHLIYTAHCALLDPDPTNKAACQAILAASYAAKGNSTTVWQAYVAPDGSFPALLGGETQYGCATGTASWCDSSSTVDLVPGSAHVVGHGTHWSTMTWTDCLGGLHTGSTTNVAAGSPGSAAVQNASLMWFLNGTAEPALDNSNGDSVLNCIGSITDDTHMDLASPYAGSQGSGAGWQRGTDRLAGWGNQPFMEGILAVGHWLAGKSLETYDPTSSALAYSYASGLATWLRTAGYSDPALGGVGGMSYFASFVGCGTRRDGQCSHDTGQNVPYNASQARTDAAEAVRGMMLVYSHTSDATLKAAIDTLYAQMYCDTALDGAPCAAGFDGNYVSDLGPGGGFMTADALMNKWLGFFFGFDNGAAWPGYRVGGVAAPDISSVYVGFHLAAITNATHVRVTATAPDGTVTTTSCSSSPCSVSVDRREGDHLMTLDYLSAGNAVLASSQLPVVQRLH